MVYSVLAIDANVIRVLDPLAQIFVRGKARWLLQGTFDTGKHVRCK